MSIQALYAKNLTYVNYFEKKLVFSVKYSTNNGKITSIFGVFFFVIFAASLHSLIMPVITCFFSSIFLENLIYCQIGLTFLLSESDQPLEMFLPSKIKLCCNINSGSLRKGHCTVISSMFLDFSLMTPRKVGYVSVINSPTFYISFYNSE